jgi:hypothetical protein
LTNPSWKKMKHTFPFGQQLHPVVQTDSTPKKAFVLGVYASAVHARWPDDSGKQKVAAFGDSADTYGRSHEITIAGKAFQVIPLCHPRQAQRLGASSKTWHKLHQQWIQKK